MTKINASDGVLKVLEAWGVKNIYGLPGGSFDSTMNAIYNYRDRINYVGVRHEEVGALAAVAEAKLTGRIGVTFGSAGPGAAHLLNGLYDAKTDHVPVLALVGQVPTSRMNTDYFQEMPEDPMFADVAVYNRTATTAEGLPRLVDHAIREAYAKRGVSVIVIPKDLGWTEIEDDFTPTADAYIPPTTSIQTNPEDVKAVADLISKAKRPIIYFGQGAKGASEDLLGIAHDSQVPLVSTYLAKGVVPDGDEAYMVTTGRIATKSGVDAARVADLVVFIGTNYEFPMFAPDAKFVDVNIDPAAIGERHPIVRGVLADAPAFLSEQRSELKNHDISEDRANWFATMVEDKKQWRDWVHSREESTDTPLRIEPVFKEINRVADPDAVFGVDVGNSNIFAGRFLDFEPNRRQVTSPLYATMGFGIPAGIAAKLAYPDKEVWTLSGDGAVAMVIPDLVTMARLELPVINLVFTNKSLGFIEAEQDDTHQPHSGIDLDDVDFAKVAEGFGVKGYTVRSVDELTKTLDEVKGSDKPVLIDLKVTDDRALPVEAFPVHGSDRADFDEWRASYYAEELEPVSDISARHGLTL